MTETEGSDALLGAEAIDQEKERAVKEEIALAQEEEITENAPRADDSGDSEFEFEDVDPDPDEEHPQYDELPPPEQEV